MTARADCWQRRVCTIAAGLALVISVGWACSAPSSAAARAAPCTEANSQAEMNACWGAEARERAAEVDEAAAAITAVIGELGGSEIADAVRTAQQAWSAYRDAHCATFEARMAGGSAERVAGAVCRERLAAERLAELQVLRNAWAPQ